MTRAQTMVQLTDDLNSRLDREAAQRGCSRSAIIREAISEHLDRASLDADIARYIDGYRRIPQDVPDRWGDLEGDATRNASGMARSLDAEEERNGSTWP